MIEVSEAKVEPTELDAEHLFEFFHKTFECLQALMKSEAEKLEKNGVDSSGMKFEITPIEIKINIGHYMLWHKIDHSVIRW